MVGGAWGSAGLHTKMEDSGIELVDLSLTAESMAACRAQLPWWVAKFTVTDRVRATFPSCSCRRYQEDCRHGPRAGGRSVNAATLLLVEKVILIFNEC